jgi:crossover junction endodeoxyribonuclease RuvC
MRSSSRASNLRPINGQGVEGKQIVLGIDPGSIVTGYGAICVDNDEVTAVEWGVIRAKKTDPITQRLLTIYRTLIEIIDTFKPSCVAVERPFYGKNVSALIAMGQSVGVALLAAAEMGVEVYEYTPREVKKSVVGSGGASKEQVQRMVCVILGLQSDDTPLDATDALAVALCHENRMKDLDTRIR